MASHKVANLGLQVYLNNDIIYTLAWICSKCCFVIFKVVSKGRSGFLRCKCMNRALYRKTCPDNAKLVENCGPVQPKEEDDICCQENPDTSNKQGVTEKKRQNIDKKKVKLPYFKMKGR